MIFSRLQSLNANNFATLYSSPLSEISGSLGDLGTLLPLMIALAINDSISLSTTLVFSGLWNIITGVIFGIPLPVQPMKAIAAVAISRKFTIEETISAGFTTSSLVFLFSITGLLRWFTRTIPTPIVKGIQVGAGLSLIISAGSSLLQPLGWITPNGFDNLLWAIIAFIFLVLTQKSPRVPYALLVFLLGVVFSLLITGTSLSVSPFPSFKIWHPKTYLPTLSAFKTGALDAGLGQIPLTTLNSIIAVTYLSADLLPHIPPPSVTSIGISVALMNLIGGWFGAMPVCHGSGGLAAQYRFGARSGASIIILGLFKILLGLFFGESLITLLKEYPRSLLGVMVFAAGLELAKVGESLNHGAMDLWEVADSSTAPDCTLENGEWPKRRREVSDEERHERWMIMFMTIAGLLAFKNDGVGFIVGVLCNLSYRSGEILDGWRRTIGGSQTQRQTRNERRRSFPEEEQQLLPN